MANSFSARVDIEGDAAQVNNGILEEQDDMSKYGHLLDEIGNDLIPHRPTPPMELTCFRNNSAVGSLITGVLPIVSSIFTRERDGGGDLTIMSGVKGAEKVLILNSIILAR
ncbi:hypothetical protein ACH5RR_029926 [Cinchona calisaya]|uniref:Uncharacterized protein n=1 Tax=Cinchona calisaya TaxID=153742 RepID=A0ABD2YWP5_9GENT